MGLRRLLVLLRQNSVRARRLALKGMRVRDAMKILPVVNEGTTLREVLRRMLEGRSTVLPVESAHIDCGIIGIDALKRADPSDWDALALDRFARHCDAPADADEPLEETYLKLLLNPDEALPVASAGKLIGIIRLCDLREIIELRKVFLTNAHES